MRVKRWNFAFLLRHANLAFGGRYRFQEVFEQCANRQMTPPVVLRVAIIGDLTGQTNSNIQQNEMKKNGQNKCSFCR